MEMHDRQRLAELGNRLEAAVTLQVSADRYKPDGGTRSARARRRVQMFVAVGAAGIIIGAIWFLAPSPDQRPVVVQTAAGAVVEVAAIRPVAARTGEGPTGDDFAQQVFVHLFRSTSEVGVTCVSAGTLRYQCDVVNGEPLPEVTDSQRLLFVERGRVLGGACVRSRQDRSSWDCALGDAAVHDAFLDSAELDAITPSKEPSR